MTVDATPEAQQAANKIVHEVALRPERFKVAKGAHAIRQLGFEALARRLEQRACDVRVWAEGSNLVVKTCMVGGDGFGDFLAAWRQIPGRRWDRERRVSVVPKRQREALWRFLQEFFPGKVVCGPKGPFRIGEQT